MNSIYTQQELDDILQSFEGIIILGFLGDVLHRKDEIGQLTEFIDKNLNRLKLYLVSPTAGSIWRSFNITGKPTYLIFRSGKLIERWLGRMTRSGFETIIENINEMDVKSG